MAIKVKPKAIFQELRQDIYVPHVFQRKVFQREANQFTLRICRVKNVFHLKQERKTWNLDGQDTGFWAKE